MLQPTHTCALLCFFLLAFYSFGLHRSDCNFLRHKFSQGFPEDFFRKVEDLMLSKKAFGFFTDLCSSAIIRIIRRMQGPRSWSGLEVKTIKLLVHLKRTKKTPCFSCYFLFHFNLALALCPHHIRQRKVRKSSFIRPVTTAAIATAQKITECYSDSKKESKQTHHTRTKSRSNHHHYLRLVNKTFGKKQAKAQKMYGLP